MMSRKENIETIREMLGSEATLLDASYVLQELEGRGLGIEDAEAMAEDEFFGLVDEALRAGAEDVRNVLSSNGGIPASVEDALTNGLLEAIEEWLREIDHVAAYRTSETCLLGAAIDSLDDLERDAASRGPREAIEEFVGWWARAYDAYLKARELDKLADVCELLLTGSLDAAEEIVQG